MKVYYGMNKKCIWRAALDRSQLAKFDEVYETDLPVVHDKVFLVRIYYGFDYNYDSGGMFDVFAYSDRVYHSMRSLKKNDPLWLMNSKLASKDPDKYYVDDFRIASDDCGQPFTYGDVMGDNFNMEIICIKVSK